MDVTTQLRRTSEQPSSMECLENVVTNEKLQTGTPRSDETDPTSMTERRVISSCLML